MYFTTAQDVIQILLDCGLVTAVVPAAPTFGDVAVTVPTITGVQWLVNEYAVANGAHYGNGNTTVRARGCDGKVVSPTSVDSWFHVYPRQYFPDPEVTGPGWVLKPDGVGTMSQRTGQTTSSVGVTTDISIVAAQSNQWAILTTETPETAFPAGSYAMSIDIARQDAGYSEVAVHWKHADGTEFGTYPTISASSPVGKSTITGTVVKPAGATSMRLVVDLYGMTIGNRVSFTGITMK